MLIALSMFVTALASFTALSLTERVVTAAGRARYFWLMAAGIALGIGIWSVQLLGMVTLETPVGVAFELPLLSLSAASAIGGSILALGPLTSRSVSMQALMVSALILVAAMIGTHYIGMLSLRPDERLAFTPWLLSLVTVIAVSVSIVALRLAVHSRSSHARYALAGRLASAGALAVAVTAFYRGGLAAARFTPMTGPEIEPAAMVLVTPGLAALVATGLLVTLGFALLAIAVDRDRAEVEVRAEVLRQSELALEQRVAERTNQLEQANRELEDLTYSAAHDLRAPLRGIAGYSSIVLEEYGEGLDSTARDYLRRIQLGTERIGELIDDLLYLSHISRAEVVIRDVDLSEIALAAFRDLRDRESERTVSFRVEPGVVVRGDERLLRIAVEKLIENSWKFTGEEAHSRIDFGRVATANGDAIFVNDNGVGFDMRFGAKLFAPFQRLHHPEQFEGTGMGLAVAQRVIERQSGQIWAESELGQGATFYFTVNPTEDAQTDEYSVAGAG